MINSIDEFISAFNNIKQMGWIKTHRSGNTGVGKTLEDLLGIPENNLQEPDFGEYELKASRSNSSSMLTLFTKSPLPKGANTQLRIMYGYASSAYNNTEKVLHTTLNSKSFTPIANTGNSLKIDFATSNGIDIILVESQHGPCDAYWIIDDLEKNFYNKYPNKFVYVKADSRGTGIDEEFYYHTAFLCDGFNYDGIIQLLSEGKLYVDLRIGQYPDGRTHDHGTAFRIKECDQDYLFQKHKLV